MSKALQAGLTELNGTRLTRPDGKTIPAYTAGGMVAHALIKHKAFDAGDRKWTPKARVEESGKAFTRMVKEFDKECTESTRAKAVGKVTGSKARPWVISATDGHRAILKAGGKGEACNYADISGESWDGAHVGSAVIRDKEFYNAVERAAVMADERSRMVKLKVVKTETQQGIELFSGDSDMGDFSEFVECEVGKVSKNGFEVGLNVEYLLDVLGVWPVRMQWLDKDTFVVFEPDAHESVQAPWRAVVMPMRF